MVLQQVLGEEGKIPRRAAVVDDISSEKQRDRAVSSGRQRDGLCNPQFSHAVSQGEYVGACN